MDVALDYILCVRAKSSREQERRSGILLRRYRDYREGPFGATGSGIPLDGAFS